jgi:hypothetical protein
MARLPQRVRPIAVPVSLRWPPRRTLSERRLNSRIPSARSPACDPKRNPFRCHWALSGSTTFPIMVSPRFLRLLSPFRSPIQEPGKGKKAFSQSIPDPIPRALNSPLKNSQMVYNQKFRTHSKNHSDLSGTASTGLIRKRSDGEALRRSTGRRPILAPAFTA